MIRERTLSGIRAAQAAGKVVGRPKRVFRRDEVVRLRDQEGLSWRAIGKKLGIPAMTALDSYRQMAPATCTETVQAEKTVSGEKRKKKIVAAYVYGSHGFSDAVPTRSCDAARLATLRKLAAEVARCKCPITKL